MANQRSKDKIKVQTYLHKDDEKLLREAAKARGYPNLAEFLQAVARESINVPPKIQALAFAAIGAGTGNGGCGPLCCLLILAAVAALVFA